MVRVLITLRWGSRLDARVAKGLRNGYGVRRGQPFASSGVPLLHEAYAVST
jgi:hypothetical protein